MQLRTGNGNPGREEFQSAFGQSEFVNPGGLHFHQ